MSKDPDYEVSALGVPEWHMRTRNGVGRSISPFEELLVDGVLDNTPNLKDAALLVHDTLYTARSIAMFGPTWRDHIWQTFDRLCSREQRAIADGAEDPCP